MGHRVLLLVRTLHSPLASTRARLCDEEHSVVLTMTLADAELRLSLEKFEVVLTDCVTPDNDDGRVLIRTLEENRPKVGRIVVVPSDTSDAEVAALARHAIVVVEPGTHRGAFVLRGAPGRARRVHSRHRSPSRDTARPEGR